MRKTGVGCQVLGFRCRVAVLLWVLCLLCGTTKAGSIEPLSHRAIEPLKNNDSMTQSPNRSFGRGCPACCCAVRIPKGTSNKNAMRFCMKSEDETCKKMCRGWMKERGLRL